MDLASTDQESTMNSTQSKAPQKTRKKVTTLGLRRKKMRGEVITMLTAYDHATALALDQAGIDSILVGDSLGMVVLGYANTLQVTMEDMIHHCRAVARGTQYALTIGDMPFMSYQVSVQEAVRNAGRLIQEGGMDAVKLEGGSERVGAAEAIVSAGIPVMGHLGLTPQSVHQLGGFRPQGLDIPVASRILDDALMLQDAGCFSIVLESVPARLASLISKRLEIPTIGIGAGPGCDGQVLVTPDMLGLFQRFRPKFVKQFADLHTEMVSAFSAYIKDVQADAFPGVEHSITMPEETWHEFLESLNGDA
jgi:3-methyl-2-oxobutanoate hydroxymethyltransferase